MISALFVAQLFPGALLLNVQVNFALLLNALAKQQMADAEMISMAVASVRVEAAGFKPVREGQSRFNTVHVPFDVYEPPSRKAKDLGNTEKGDGFRYRGNGLPQLTGRYNHRIIGMRIGLPLEERPEILMEPENSCLALASFLKRDEYEIRQALRKGDFRAARRLYNGGSHGLEIFTATYKAIRAKSGAMQLPPVKPPGLVPMPILEATNPLTSVWNLIGGKL